MDDAVAFDCPVRPASSCVFSHWEQGQLIFYALDPVQGRGKELARTKLGPSTFGTGECHQRGLALRLRVRISFASKSALLISGMARSATCSFRMGGVSGP